MRIAILDDYGNVAMKLAEWGRVPGVTAVPFGDHVFQSEELVARLSGFDAVFRIRERTHLPREVLERLPQLKLILATGARNAKSIDLAAARSLGITVCSTDTIQRETVEVTWWLLLSLFRRLPWEAASVRVGGWQLGVGRRLAGKTLGILGLGTMGIPVARVAQAFEMNVQAWSPNLTSERAATHGVRAVSKVELFETSDAITVHVPMSTAAIGLVGRDEIARMKPEAFLINTSRAHIVDQEALIQVLRDHGIGGYGVDVYESEPMPIDHPLRHLPNVVATPHVGYVTQENYELFFSQSLENLAAFLQGHPIRVIN